MTLLRRMISFPAHVDCEALVEDEGGFQGPPVKCSGSTTISFLRNIPLHHGLPRNRQQSLKTCYQLTVVVES